ncbi:hypothetical protein H2201_002331 [Coniosporium apollinis]|uniref:Ricin B lectin domain-containing protein n=1 Tax=Coniosporium apollinis TaxID=61459 RepID=A0ABQ9P3N1_9PEZI|nr:hypothetical protein H2201_002331 [Coniosporium apollinis]
MATPPSMPDGWYDGKDRDQFFTSKWNRGCYVRFTGSFQNAQGGTMLDLYGGGGHTPAVAGFSDGGPSNKNQIWKLVEVISGAYAIVNVGNNHHIVAQGKNQPVLCDDRSIDDKKGWWRLSGQTGNNKNKFETLR